jgi:hypothetical protein
MAFQMPTLATVTIFAGLTLAVRIGVLANAGPWITLVPIVAFTLAVLVLGWVFWTFHDRRWQSFFALVVLANGAHLAAEVANAGLTIPGVDLIILLILMVMVVLTGEGFDILMLTEMQIYLGSCRAKALNDRIGPLGLRNANLSGIQGVYQVIVIVLIVYLRWGGF